MNFSLEISILGPVDRCLNWLGTAIILFVRQSIDFILSFNCQHGHTNGFSIGDLLLLTVSICSCILMMFLCKTLFTDQESNVHYYLFSHDHCCWTIEHWRLLFVIISIIIEQIKHLRIIKTIGQRRKAKFLLVLSSLRWTREASHTVTVLIFIVWQCIDKHTYRFRAEDGEEEERKRGRINWYPLE